jgi:hypothetical protein
LGKQEDHTDASIKPQIIPSNKEFSLYANVERASQRTLEVVKGMLIIWRLFNKTISRPFQFFWVFGNGFPLVGRL